MINTTLKVKGLESIIKGARRLSGEMKTVSRNTINDTLRDVQKRVERKEGEVWEEDGRKWELKGGVKQNISKLQELRKVNTFPIFCPKCKKKMDEKYDKPLYKIHQHCFECQLQFEKELKLSGKYEEYKNQVHNSEIDGMIGKYEDWVEDLINGSNDGFVTEQGDVERWSKTNYKQILSQKDQVLETLKKLKK